MDFCSLILLAVSSLIEHVRFVSWLRHSLLPVVERVLELCWTLWSVAEEHLRQKEIEEQSLYKFRTKTHVIQDSEEEVCERQLRDMFPSYEGSMEDELSGGAENMEEDKGRTEDGLDTDITGAPLKFSEDEVRHVAHLHLLMYGEVDPSSRPLDSEKISYELSSCLTNSLGSIPGTYIYYSYNIAFWLLMLCILNKNCLCLCV